MAAFDQLPSGMWRATVVTPIKLPNGRNKRLTKSFHLKGQAETWAKLEEGAIAAGTWADRGPAITLGEYREEWRRHKLADGATLDKVDSFWRTHLAEVWGGHPLPVITRPDLKGWVKRIATEQCSKCRAFPGTEEGDEGLALVDHHTTATWRDRKRVAKGETAKVLCAGSGERAGLGAWTIQGVVGHLSGLLTAAVEDGRLAANPAIKLDLPTAAPKPIFYWTPDDAARILLELGGADALAVELDMYIGLRPGELHGMRKRYVDQHMWRINVHGVATRRGWRAYAKTKKSHRSVPVPKHLRERFAEHLDELGPDDLVFPAPDGGVWDDREFAQRVFLPAVRAAGVPSGTPYDMRHTAASWLVQRGVDLQRVQELLGHEKYTTTLRYAHLAPQVFDEVLDAWGDAPLDPRTQPRPRYREKA